MQDKKQQLEPDMEQWTGSKLGKEYVKAVHRHPAYLTYMTNLDSILKNRDITLPTKVRLVKAMIFPVMLLNCGVGEDSWESLGLQGDPTSPF